ncbi:TIGR00730 family Rossman fold protein [Pseudaestuariivita atlantica]|uniref:Cytokinin riboside 5'-monophosphate phosphoribohydrolase n=1 Tax=Pseudaestuariivita atlantica TaxID=1317121 RepID=A0A0L1JUA1_9RHOB|nr:TIGR00730 family Rossman fold protein [Pseudaestuariivita atlantica]KNG95359.1 decarboxylase [Pseudaestuariivita atlantica]
MARLSVCVFCGARPGAQPAYAAMADATGRMLAEFGARLVYGAGDMGIMGAVSAAAQEAGGETLGVIPGHLVPRERGGRVPHGQLVTETMHERKKVMFMNSDVTLLLPGGAGSLDEVFEVLTWRQIGLHDKPIVILNGLGFWTPLLDLVDHVIAEGFADASLRDMLTVCDDVEAVKTTLERLASS